MNGGAAAEAAEPVAPDEWETAPERDDAGAQQRLAEHVGVDVASRSVDTDPAGRSPLKSVW